MKTALPSSAKSEFAQIISAKGGRATPMRLRVLDILKRAATPITYGALVQALRQDAREDAPNRVTLYRVLRWLKSQKLIHEMMADDRQVLYGLGHPFEHAHAHFLCEHCGLALCLKNLQSMVTAQLPQGYTFNYAELTLRGICRQCRK